MLVFIEGWNVGANNNSPRALGEADLDAAIRVAVEKLKEVTTDEEFIHLWKCVTSASAMLKAKVVKGMHQETGHQIVPETHCTIETTDFPPKRFHIWWIYIKTGWFASRVTYEVSAKQYKTANI